MNRDKKRKCKHCRRMFRPDCRNHTHQEYCDKPECRKASKTASQKKWLMKPENKHYFKGHDHVERVNQWRKKNPGYWQRKRLPEPKADDALQDRLRLQPIEIINDNGEICAKPLQDLLILQHSVMIGLIAQLSGFSLQDNIEEIIRRMQQSGQDILYHQHNIHGGIYDYQSPDFK